MKKMLSLLLGLLMLLGLTPLAHATDAPALSYHDDITPITFEMYIDYDWYMVDTWGNDEVSQKITELTGVTLDVHKASDLAELGVLVAAGELPDFIFTSNLTQRFEDPDVCYPWNELIEQYVPDFYETTGLREIDRINNTAADGNIYTFVTHYHYWDDERDYPSYGDRAIHVRRDIVEALGMQMEDIDSIEKLLEVFDLVNERKEELGIDVIYNPHPTWSIPLTPLADYMGVKSTARYPFVDDEGNARTVYSEPMWPEYLAMLNELYNKGYIYKDAFAVRPEDYFALNNTGTVFCTSYNTTISQDTNTAMNKNGMEDKEFWPLLEMTYKGENRRVTYDASKGFASLFISKNCKDPERAIKFVEFLRAPEGDQLTQWGIEGLHYTLNEDGLVIMTDYWRDTVAEKGDGMSMNPGGWYFQGSGLGEGVKIASALSQPGLTDQQLRWAQPTFEALAYSKSTYQPVPHWYHARVAVDSDEYTIQTKLADYWNSKMLEVIMAPDAESSKALFDEMMAYMNDNGLPQLEAAMDANYKAKLPLYEEYLKENPIP